MKKIISALLAAAVTGSVSYAGDIGLDFCVGSFSAWLNGEKISSYSYLSEMGNTMAELRTVSETLGASVEWDGDLREVGLSDEGLEMRFKIDSDEVTVNGGQRKMTEAAVIRNDKTMVPIRFISESFGAEVGYDYETKRVTVRAASRNERISALANSGTELAAKYGAALSGYLELSDSVLDSAAAKAVWDSLVNTRIMELLPGRAVNEELCRVYSDEAGVEFDDMFSVNAAPPGFNISARKGNFTELVYNAASGTVTAHQPLNTPLPGSAGAIGFSSGGSGGSGGGNGGDAVKQTSAPTASPKPSPSGEPTVQPSTEPRATHTLSPAPTSVTDEYPKETSGPPEGITDEAPSPTPAPSVTPADRPDSNPAQTLLPMPPTEQTPSATDEPSYAAEPTQRPQPTKHPSGSAGGGSSWGGDDDPSRTPPILEGPESDNSHFDDAINATPKPDKESDGMINERCIVFPGTDAENTKEDDENGDESSGTGNSKNEAELTEAGGTDEAEPAEAGGTDDVSDYNGAEAVRVYAFAPDRGDGPRIRLSVFPKRIERSGGRAVIPRADRGKDTFI